MFRTISAFWLVLFSVYFASEARAPQGASIDGVVRNGTTETSLANVTVTLTSPAGGLDSERETKTDAEGRFHFKDVPLRGFYLARVVHDDVVYNAPVAFRDAATPAKVELIVYDAAAPEVPLTFTRIEASFRVMGREVEVERRYQVENPSNKAIRGNSDQLRFRLESIPPDLESQAKQTAWLDVSVVPTADEGAHTVRFDLKPGLTDISLHYHLPYEDQRFLAEETLFHPAQVVVLAVGPDGLDLAPGDGLVPSGQSAGSTLFEAKDVAAGQTLSVGVSGKPTGLKIHGRVVNKTQDAPAGDVQLDLAEISSGRQGASGSPHGGGDVPTWEGRTAADGSFVFEGLPVEEGAFYVLRATYGGVDYSEHVRFSGETDVELEIDVYDTVARDQAQVSLRVRDTLIFVDGQRMMFRAYYQFINDSDRTVAPEGAVRLAVPADAENIHCNAYSRLGEQLVPLARRTTPVSGQAGVHALDWPLKPGETTVDIYFELPYSGSRDLTLPFPNGAESITAMIGPSAVEVSSSDLRFDRKFTPPAQGSSSLGELEVFQGGPIAPGKSVTIRISGKGNLPGSIVIDRMPGSVSRLTMIIGPGILVLLAIALVVTFSGRASQQARVGQERERLLSEVADLDDRFAAGQVERGDYEEQRLALLGRIREIWDA